jgi:hypothetical protein
VAPALVLLGLGGALVAQRHGLWYDELYTAEVAPAPLRDLVDALLRGEGTIPYLRDAPPSYNAPYYLVAHVWLAVTRLPADEVGLRLLSLAAAVAAVAVLTRAVARLAGRRVATVAGLVVATNPFVVEYAAEARGYGLALLATAVAAWAVIRALEVPAPAGEVMGAVAGAEVPGGAEDGSAPAGRWLGTVPTVALATAAAGLAHWFALLAVAGLVVGAVAVRRRAAAPIVLGAALGALPAAGLLAVAVANGVGASGAEWIHDAGLAVPVKLVRSWSGRWWPLAAVTVAAAGAALAPPWPADGRRRRAAVLGAGWFAVPVALVVVAQQARPVYVDRYLLPACLGLALLVALGATRARGRWGAAAVALVVGVSALGGLAALGRGPKEDVRGAVAAVAAAHRPGQPVVAGGRWDALGVDHHVRRLHPELGADVVLPPAPVPDADVVWVVRRAGGGVKGDPEKVDALEAELAGRGLRMADVERFGGRYGTTRLERWAR